MPGFDGRGPAGRGPKTGRGFGICRSAGISAGGYWKSLPEARTGNFFRWAGFARSRRRGVDAVRKQEEQ